MMELEHEIQPEVDLNMEKPARERMENFMEFLGIFLDNGSITRDDCWL